MTRFSISTLLLLVQTQSILSLTFLALKGPPSLPSSASSPLNPALASFSIETAFFEAYLGNFSAPNNLTLNLLNHLKQLTGVSPEIRIGGITADSTYWRPGQSVALSNFIDDRGILHNTTIGPEFWKVTALLPADAKFIMNLKLRDMLYDGALTMARATLDGLKPDQLAVFEIGNEPDHYNFFTPQSYASTWHTWTKNITTTLNISGRLFQIGATVDDPLWPYNTPASNAQLDCVSAIAAGANNASTVKTCSEHAYQYSVCDPQRAAIATLPHLLNHTRIATYLDLWQPRIHFIRERIGPDSFVFGEFNSVSCSGKDGVSNTFGQALWILDTVFYAASLNVSKLYLHQGGPLALQSQTQLNKGGLSYYNMWYPVANQNGPIQVFPSFVAYLFIADTLGSSKTLRIANLYPGKQTNGSTLTTALGDESAGQLVVYGFWDTSSPSAQSFPVKLALLNLEIFNQTQMGPRPAVQVNISEFRMHPQIPITIRRMQAPGTYTNLGNLTTWAGQTFASGMPVGKLVEERQNGSIVAIAVSEAVLITITNQADRANLNAPSSDAQRQSRAPVYFSAYILQLVLVWFRDRSHH